MAEEGNGRGKARTNGAVFSGGAEGRGEEKVTAHREDVPIKDGFGRRVARNVEMISLSKTVISSFSNAPQDGDRPEDVILKVLVKTR